MVRITFIVANAYAIGGTVRAVLDTAAALAGRHEVEVVSVLRHRDEPRFRPDPRVSLQSLLRLDGPLLQPATLSERARLFRHRHGDLRELPSRLIHPNDNRVDRFSLASDVLLERELRRPRDGVLVGSRAGVNLAIARWAHPDVLTVGQEHVPFRRYPGPLQRSIRRYYPRLDVVTVLTPEDHAALAAEVDGSDTLVRQIPNVLSPVAAEPVTHERKIVVTGGRISHEKGFDRLVDAWPIVAREHPDWRLRIHGSGPELEKLTAQVAASPAADTIELPGFTADLRTRLAEGSIFVLSSRHEGFGLVLLEAMGHGLPVVSFDCDHGPRNIVTDGRDGVLVPDGDIPELARAINDLIDDPARRRELGAAAARTAATYRPEAVAELWETMLDDARERGVGEHRRRVWGRPHWRVIR